MADCPPAIKHKMPSILLHQTWHLSWQIYIYRTMDIYLCQIDPPPPTEHISPQTITPHKFPSSNQA